MTEILLAGAAQVGDDVELALSNKVITIRTPWSST
jgi:hypothetical protein